jgi:hypothetical protein
VNGPSCQPPRLHLVGFTATNIKSSHSTGWGLCACPLRPRSVVGRSRWLSNAFRTSALPPFPAVVRDAANRRDVPCVDGPELAREIFTSRCWSVQPCVRPVHDAFQAHLAGVTEDYVARIRQVLVDAQARQASA